MGKKTVSDKDLIIKALQNDQNAYSYLYNKYKAGLATHISKYIQDQEDVKDICQETFRKAFLQLNSYKPEYKFSTWLYSIGTNTALDHRKKLKPDLVSNLQDTPEDLYEMISLTPEEEMVFEEKTEEIHKAISSLREIYRKPAELKFLNGYRNEEIAQELGIPVTTVRVRILRAKLAIIAILNR